MLITFTVLTLGLTWIAVGCWRNRHSQPDEALQAQIDAAAEINPYRR